jgi:hypothetical protein
MRKQALDIDAGTVAKSVVGGAIGGAGVMSAITLLRMLAAQRRDAQGQVQPDDTNEDTIVLTLPQKKAEDAPPGSIAEDRVYGSDNPEKKVDHPKSRHNKLVAKRQFRNFDGTIGTKVAATGWPTQTASALGVVGGGLAGAALVDRIYAIHREMKLKREIEAAKQEYLDMLQGGEPKTAEARSILYSFTPVGTEKQAGAESFGAQNYPMTVMALLTLMGSGSTAYITKKILDEKLRESEDVGFDPPKVNRILIRSAKSPQPQEIGQDEFKAAMVMAIQSELGTVGPLADDDMKLALAKIGESPNSFLKKAQDQGVADLIADMREKYPDILSSLQTKFTQAQSGPMAWIANKFPGMFKSLANFPGLRNIADNKTKSMLSNALYPEVKLAQKAPIGPMLAAAFGGDILNDPDETAKKVVDEQERRQRLRKSQELTPEAGNIRVEAQDSAALKYLMEHKNEVRALLKNLAAGGRV